MVYIVRIFERVPGRGKGSCSVTSKLMKFPRVGVGGGGGGRSLYIERLGQSLGSSLPCLQIDRMTHRHDWKHYLEATSLAGGIMGNRIIINNYQKQMWMGCECESLNGLLKIDFIWFMMTGPLLVWNKKLAVRHFTFKIYSLKRDIPVFVGVACYHIGEPRYSWTPLGDDFGFNFVVVKVRLLICDHIKSSCNNSWNKNAFQ